MRTGRPGIRKRERGGETVEFALTLLLFFLVFFMIVDFAVVMFDQGTMITASRYGTRQASLYWVDPPQFNPTTPLQNRRMKRAMVDSVVTWAENNLLISPDGSGLSATFEINATPVSAPMQVVVQSDVVSVNVTYPHQYMGLSLANLSGINMDSASSLIVE